MSSLFIVGEAVKRLVTLAGDNLEQVLRCFQRIIDDPVYRRQVWLAMTGELVVSGITEQEWIEREAAALDRLGIKGESVPAIARAAGRGFGVSFYFVPGGVGRDQLLKIAGKIGIKLHSSPDCDGGEFPTERGVLEYELDKIMVPTDSNHRPFNLGYQEHLVWAKEQGGDDLTSVEETLYLLIRAYLELGRIPFVGGRIHCRSCHGFGHCSLYVFFSVGDGLCVGWDDLGYRGWFYGAVPRKFTPLS